MANESIPQLEQTISELRSQQVPSTQLIDALNALTQGLLNVDVQQALVLAKEARVLSGLLQYHIGTATSLAQLSWLHLQDGTFDAAVIEAHEALFYAEKQNDYALTANATLTIASAYQMANDFAKAEKHWHKALGLARANSYHEREADYLSELGVLYLEHGDYVCTIEYSLQAQSLYLETGDARLIIIKNNIALAFMKLSREDEAVTLAEGALKLCEPEWVVWRAEILHTLGVAHLSLSDYDLAQTYLSESLALSQTAAGRKYTAAEVLLDMSKLEIVHNRITGAFNKLDQALRLATEIKAVALQAEAHHALSRLYMIAHDRVGADEHFEHYLRYRRTVEYERVEKRMNLFRIEAEVERRQVLWAQEGLRA